MEIMDREFSADSIFIRLLFRQMCSVFTESNFEAGGVGGGLGWGGVGGQTAVELKRGVFHCLRAQTVTEALVGKNTRLS